MTLLAGIVSSLILTVIFTLLLDFMNNRNNEGSYQLATTLLNLAIGFVTSLALHLLIGYNHIGSKILSFLGFSL